MMNDKNNAKGKVRDDIMKKLRSIDPVAEMQVKQMKEKIKEHEKDKKLL